MRVVRFAILVSALALVILVGWTFVKHHQSVREWVPGATASYLQDIAKAACTCEFNHPEHKTCWSAYETETRGLRMSRTATACSPISTENDCFTERGREVCVVTGYRIVDLPEPITLCNETDARAVTNAYFKTQAQHPDDHQTLIASLRHSVNLVRRGGKLAMGSNDGGCL